MIDKAIDGVIDRLVAALDAAGLPPLRPAVADVDAVLARIAAEIFPLRLPAQLETFWRRLDPTSLVVVPHPEPAAPAFALSTWLAHRDDSPGMTPRLLFPVCYESHSFLFVELDAPGRPGGACLSWSYGGTPFRVAFADLAAYLDLLTAMIELGEVAEVQIGARTYHQFDPGRLWDDFRAARLQTSLPLPGYGTTTELSEDVRAWPERWLRSNGLHPADRGPRGATCTIADLVRTADAGIDASGTIEARVVHLVGSPSGRRVAVDDGTGMLDVWCPTKVCTYGPVLARVFELDVVVRSARSTPLDADDVRGRMQRAALAGDLAGAQDAVVELYAEAFGTPARAQASAVRPLD